jgi:putative membrane protein
MILRRMFSPVKVARYLQMELTLTIAASAGAFVLYSRGLLSSGLPFSVAAILGSALAIFIAFRNNSAYGRWWEARTIWGGIINSSRAFARQIIANADNAAASGKVTAEQAEAYKREIVYRTIAFAHALRLHLRRQTTAEEYRHLLPADEFAALQTKQNPPNILLQTQGIRIKEGVRAEVLGPFDNISLEPTLASLNNHQGACERIKNTPLLRQYDFFTRLFLVVFIVLLPFCLVGDFQKINLPQLMPVISVLLAFVFATMGKVGEVNEDPFENRITDIPMTAMCNTIERDLKEMLGETDLPAKLLPEDGYLW